MADTRITAPTSATENELPVAQPRGFSITPLGPAAAPEKPAVRHAGKWFRLRFTERREIVVGGKTYAIPCFEGWNQPQTGQGFWGMMQKDATEEGAVFATCLVWPNGMVAVFEDAAAMAQLKRAIAEDSPLAKGQDATMAAVRAQVGAPRPAPAPRAVTPPSDSAPADELPSDDEPPF